MTTKIEPSVAWVWDKCKEYGDQNDMTHGRMLRMISQLEHDNQALKMEINDLKATLNNLIARERMY